MSLVWAQERCSLGICNLNQALRKESGQRGAGKESWMAWTANTERILKTQQ